MTRTKGNALKAYDYLSDLQQTVGARLPGSQGEAKAIAWLQQQCKAIGLTPENERFVYQADSWLTRIRSAGLAYSMVVLTLLSARLNPWLILAGVLVSFVVFGQLWRLLERGTARAVGQNILAGITRPWSEIVAQPAQRVVFLCAHYDTAPSVPAWRRSLGRYNDFAAGFAFLGVLILVAYSLVAGSLSVITATARLAESLRFIWQSFGAWLVLALGLPGAVIVMLSLLTYRSGGKLSENPGADDNGSGVAVVLELANKLKQHSTTGVDLAVAFWAAEETGLWGSEAFVEKYQHRLDREKTLIINVDTVGRGQCLMAVSGEGVLRRRAVDGSVLLQWEQACQQVGTSTIREWLTPLAGSSDHAAWLNSGFNRALSVGRGNLVPIAPPIRLLNRLLGIPTGATQTDISHVHSPSDSLTNIRPECLDETTDGIRTFLDLQV
ncbi:MAG: M20/M25/M40 family metallo-hydrolase [Anaerolineales bacterium]|nr:M20/M25/M40 family metallo-hydrolase [Anaerolineales bacterium]